MITPLKTATRQRFAGDAGGATTFWVFFFTGVMFLILGLLTEGGQAIAEKQRANGIAREAARVGVNAIDPDAYLSGQKTPARNLRVAAQDHCAGQVPAGWTCTTTVSGQEVTVSVAGTVNSRLLPAVGAFQIQAESTARPAIGVTGEGA